MACKYVLRGHEFASELELDDFLISNGKYLKDFGDMVFQKSMDLLHIHNILNNVSKEAWELSKKAWKSEDKDARLYDADLDEMVPGYQKPYIGTTQFLRDRINSEGKMIIKTFEKDNYFAARKSDWSRKIFTDKEVDILFGDRSKIPTTVNAAEMELYVKKIEYRWNKQARIGDLIHKVLQEYFTYEKDSLGNDSYKGKNYANFEDYILKNVNKFELNLADSNGKVIRDAIEIAKNVEKSFPEGCLFYPEFQISGALASPVKGATSIIGKIDLLVVDRQGNIHIVDYKTSPKSLSEYTDDKKRAYCYQTAIYRRLLQKAGLNLNGDCRTKVLPIVIDNLHSTDAIKGEVDYDGCHVDIPNSNNLDSMYHDISDTGQFGVNNQFVIKNLDEFITFEHVDTPEYSKVLETVTGGMKQLFSFYGTNNDHAEVAKELEKGGYLKLVDGLYRYKPKNSRMKEITANTADELVTKVVNQRILMKLLNLATTQSVKHNIKLAIDSEGQDVFSYKLPYRLDDESSQSDWFNNMIGKYTNGDWELVKDDTAEMFGIILFRNKIHKNRFDVIKISGSLNLDVIRDLSGGKKQELLTGGFINDNVEKQNTDSLMLQSSYGNMELMETMFVLNSMIGFLGEDTQFGNIQVCNPHCGTGISASNEEIVYSFDRLLQVSNLKEKTENVLKKREVGFTSRFQKAVDTLHDIMTRAKKHLFNGEYYQYSQLQTCMAKIDAAVSGDKTAQIAALEELRRKMESSEGNWSFNKPQNDQRYNMRDEQMLYNTVLSALAYLKNIDTYQLLKDTRKMFEGNILQLQGTSFDNPGMLSSKTLNGLTTLVYESYQNLRESMQKPLAEVRKLIKSLKQDEGFSWVKERTYGNQVDLYSNMIDEERSKNDIILKNPWKDNTLTEPERKFLEYFLLRVNENRLGKLTELLLLKYIDTNDEVFFRIPVMRAGSGTIINRKGLFGVAKDKFQSLSPKEMVKRFRESTLGVYDENTDRGMGELYEMVNRFDKGESTVDREEYIQAIGGKDFLELDLEKVLLSLEFAYRMKETLDDIFPMIKAISIGINNLGYEQNKKFVNTLKYVEDYIMSVIKSQAIDSQLKMLQVLGKLRHAVSLITLGFSPVLFTYQSLQGFWNDIKLYFTNPQVNYKGEKVFTIKNLKKASTLVYSDLFKHTNVVTLSSGVNELYGLNDQDTSSYVQNNMSNKNGIFNIDRLAYKMSSRPDYYNRLTIFLTQMESDGCLDAHSIKDGELVYDWKKDKRFDAFANGNTGDPRYNELRALYVRMMKQLEKEGCRDSNGELIVWKNEYLTNPKALPKAYTTQQSEGYKALADQIYGYYSHERKSMIHSTLLGALFMQFKTYWSGKKNQYLQKGGVKLQGRYVMATDAEGKQLYWKIDENGNLTDEMTTEKQSIEVPVYKWEGQWQEGIFVTIAEILRDIKDGNGFVKSFLDRWNNSDERMKLVYQANLKAFIADLSFIVLGAGIAALMGGLLKDMKKDAEVDDLVDQCEIAAVKFAQHTLKSSFLDFNFMQSIGEPITTWTPMSLEYVGNTIKKWLNVMTGDTSGWDAAWNTFAPTREFKNVIDVWKPRKDSD